MSFAMFLTVGSNGKSTDKEKIKYTQAHIHSLGTIHSHEHTVIPNTVTVPSMEYIRTNATIQQGVDKIVKELQQLNKSENNIKSQRGGQVEVLLKKLNGHISMFWWIQTKKSYLRPTDHGKVDVLFLKGHA